MAVKPVPAADATGSAEGGHTLKRGAIGLAGVVFMVVAFSAPITAMTGNLPVAVGYGNGLGAPGGFIIATVVLLVFSVGFVALARHITAAGAFYTFVSRGWSRVPGLPAGVLSMFTYMTMEAGLIGIFSAFADQAFASQFGIDLPWLVYAAICLVVIGLLSHWDISVAAKVLGVVLVAELAMLGISAVASLAHHPDGMSYTSLNPVTALSTNGVAGGVVGLGLLMAFWSWVGFESTAIYGEESKDPKRIIPRATMIAVLGVGIFYVFVSWMAIAGTGPQQSIDLAQSADTSSEIFFGPVRSTYGEWAITLFNILLVTGSFACGMAFHNCASRYLYALGREGLSAGLRKTLGATHATHGSPHVASFVQTGITLVLILAFWAAGMDPYVHMYTLLAILGTMAILVVQSLCAFAVIAYFHFHKNHPSSAHWFKTFLAPGLGGIGMLYVVYLLWEHKDAAAGAASGTLLFKVTPWIVVGLFVIGAAMATYFKLRDPRRYDMIGKVWFEDEVVRD